jgi:hypothetical protein
MLYVVACPFNQTLLLPLYTTWKERKYASFSLISLLSGRSSLTDEFPWRCCGRAHQRNEPSGKPNNNQQQRQQNKHSKKKQPGRSGIAKRTRHPKPSAKRGRGVHAAHGPDTSPTCMGEREKANGSERPRRSARRRGITATVYKREDRTDPQTFFNQASSTDFAAEIVGVPKDGDCFFACVVQGCNSTRGKKVPGKAVILQFLQDVHKKELHQHGDIQDLDDGVIVLRKLVAYDLDDTRFVNIKEFSTLGNLESDVNIPEEFLTTLSTLKDYVKRSASTNDMNDIHWANEWVLDIVSNRLSMSFLIWSIDANPLISSFIYRYPKSGLPKCYMFLRLKQTHYEVIKFNGEILFLRNDTETAKDVLPACAYEHWATQIVLSEALVSRQPRG